MLVKKVVVSKEWEAVQVMFVRKNPCGIEAPHAGIIHLVFQKIKDVHLSFVFRLFFVLF